MRKIAEAKQYQSYLLMLRKFLDQAKRILESGEELEPMGFILRTSETGKIDAGLVPLAEFPNKDAVKPVLQRLLQEMRADAIITIQDAYMYQGDAPVFEALYNEYQSVKDMPGRTECLIGMLETRDGIVHMVYHPYTCNLDKTFAWGAPYEDYSDEDVGPDYAGRLTGYFKPEKSGQGEFTMRKVSAMPDPNILHRARELETGNTVTIEWVSVVAGGSQKGTFEVTEAYVTLNGNYKFITLHRLDGVPGEPDQYKLTVGTVAGQAGDALRLEEMIAEGEPRRVDQHILSIR